MNLLIGRSLKKFDYYLTGFLLKNVIITFPFFGHMYVSPTLIQENVF